MNISNRGLNLIKSFEGFKAVPYKDIGGRLTIGFGHLIKPGEVFGALSGVEALGILSRDVQEAVNAVNEYVLVDIDQNQFDALVSFTYNLGIGNFQGSTLLHYINEGKMTMAADEFTRWDHCNGVENRGLYNRRVKEKELFLEGIVNED